MQNFKSFHGADTLGLQFKVSRLCGRGRASS